MTHDDTEAKLVHFQMQEASAKPTGDWRAAIPAVTLELAAVVTRFDAELSRDEKATLISFGAALLRADSKLDALGVTLEQAGNE